MELIGQVLVLAFNLLALGLELTILVSDLAYLLRQAFILFEEHFSLSLERRNNAFEIAVLASSISELLFKLSVLPPEQLDLILRILLIVELLVEDKDRGLEPLVLGFVADEACIGGSRPDS